MRTQTKCTLSLCGLFIVEILPIPFTAIYCLYVVRKRSPWLPEVVESLYADKPGYEHSSTDQLNLAGSDPMKTRRKCTITLASMFTLDILVPFTVPFGLYLVRRRPLWFKNVVARLYADLWQGNNLNMDTQETEDEIAESAELLEKKLLELECQNVDFVHALGKKGK
jgi:hypothetical protein